MGAISSIKRGLRAGSAASTFLAVGIAPAWALDVPSAKAFKISQDSAPEIDGDLSDNIWRTAPVIDSFFQINPVEGGVPSERTEVRIIYTDSHLYIGATMYDSAPQDITAKVMTRDSDVSTDDNIQFFIDSYDTARDSHFFKSARPARGATA